jgi:hypothetical protein
LSAHPKHTVDLPVTQNLTLIYTLSLFIGVLISAASVAGFLFRTVFYPIDELVKAFVPNDVVNLFIGVPVLLGSMGLARRGRMIGLLFWPGALLFVLDNYLAYIFSMPFNATFLLSLLIVTLSAYTLIGLVVSIDASTI